MGKKSKYTSAISRTSNCRSPKLGDNMLPLVPSLPRLRPIGSIPGVGKEDKGRTTGQTAGVTLCCWVNGSRHFEGTYRLHKTRNRPRSCLPTSILALRPARCPLRSSTSIRSKRLAHCGLNVSLSCQLPLSEYEHTTDSIRGLSCANTSY